MQTITFQAFLLGLRGASDALAPCNWGESSAWKLASNLEPPPVLRVYRGDHTGAHGDPNRALRDAKIHLGRSTITAPTLNSPCSPRRDRALEKAREGRGRGLVIPRHIAS